MQLEELIGKNTIEMAKSLPEIKWTFLHEEAEVQLKTINFVRYVRTPNKYYPLLKEERDSYFAIRAFDKLKHLDANYYDEDSNLALSSKVSASMPDAGTRQGHIPMIDLDLPKSFEKYRESTILYSIGNLIKSQLEIESRVFVKSGKANHYHFIGLGTLLKPADFITFLGLCSIIGQDYDEGKLFDIRHSYGSLMPKQHIVTSRRALGYSDSIYRFHDRFSSLRIGAKPGMKNIPYVVQVL